MSETLKPARAVAPGRIVKREIDARGWTQKDLAAIMGRPAQAITEIMQGTKRITPETALELAQAFGTSPELWTNLEANYRLRLAVKDKERQDDSHIARKSRLYSLAPIAELLKRGWIRSTDSLEELEREVCRFLDIASPDESPKLAVNFRHARERGPEIAAQIAWVKRVEHLVIVQRLPEFDAARLHEAMPQILACAAGVADVARVPDLLMSLGVHFVIVPSLPKTFIDGAAFYLPSRPVIALSLRYDRIDAFWFTLLHELAHIIAGHRELHLDNLGGAGCEGGAGDTADASVERADQEDQANSMARQWIIDSEIWPRLAESSLTKETIVLFARDMRRAPGIVLGQLQHDGLVGYNQYRSLLVKVSPYLKEWIDVSYPERAHAR